MSFVRRLLGREGRDAPESRHDPEPPPDPGAERDAELAYERDLMRAEAERLSSDLLQRQLRYADRSWTPPAQGGERRADDEDAAGERG